MSSFSESRINDFGLRNKAVTYEIIYVENESHDCIIDVADSQQESFEQNKMTLEDILLEEAVKAAAKKPYINMDVSTRLLDKRQDAAYIGNFSDTVGTNGNYIAVYDGHGGYECITAIRSFNQAEIMGNTDPVNCVIDKIKQYRISKGINMSNSGSTFAYAKIVTEDTDGSGVGYIKIGNVGDSQIMVFINGSLVFKTTEQNGTNESEVARVIREGRVHDVYINSEKKPLIHEDNKITMELAYSFNFKGIKNSLVPSSSLGHNELTGYAPQESIITFDLNNDRVKIVCSTDGLWDVINHEHPEDKEYLLTMDAGSLSFLAERRWKQEWKYCQNKDNMTKFTLTKFPSYDDIGVTTYEYVGPNVV
jgi:serine/threonine protein phosphatase PrpC